MVLIRRFRLYATSLGKTVQLGTLQGFHAPVDAIEAAAQGLLGMI
jgi:hypothetical protein